MNSPHTTHYCKGNVNGKFVLNNRHNSFSETIIFNSRELFSIRPERGRTDEVESEREREIEEIDECSTEIFRSLHIFCHDKIFIVSNFAIFNIYLFYERKSLFMRKKTC